MVCSQDWRFVQCNAQPSHTRVSRKKSYIRWLSTMLPTRQRISTEVRVSQKGSQNERKTNKGKQKKRNKPKTSKINRQKGRNRITENKRNGRKMERKFTTEPIRQLDDATRLWYQYRTSQWLFTFPRTPEHVASHMLPSKPSTTEPFGTVNLLQLSRSSAWTFPERHSLATRVGQLLTDL